MLSILSHQYTDTRECTDSHQDAGSASAQARETKQSGNLKAQLGDRLDEIAVFAFVAVAVMYIAAATYGLIW